MPARTRPAAAQEPQEAPEAAPPNGHTPEPPEERTATQGADDLAPSPADLDAARALANAQVAELDAEWRAAQAEDHPLTVWEAIAEVTRQVDAITKGRTATQGGSYKYRGIDDVLAALHPLLGETGLVIMPGEVRESRWETRATSSGGTLNVARLLVRYRLIGPDGSETSGEAWGEGGDSGDKATQKAHSQSYKSFTLQLFSIPTEASAEDEPDATNPPSRPFSREEQERAGRAYDAALEADTLDKLVGVRHRAAALLGVPVAMADGSLVPLSVLFDSRRAAIERPISDGEIR